MLGVLVAVRISLGLQFQSIGSLGPLLISGLVIDYAAFGMLTGKTVGIVGGALFTVLLARRLMPRLTHHFIEHGLVLAVTAIAFSVGGSLAGHHGLPDGYLLASVLKLTAGALPGFLYSRSTSRNRNVV